MSSRKHAQKEECLMNPPLPLPPHLYVNSPLPFFSSEPILKSGTLIIVLMQHFCDNLSFLLCVGWWKNKASPFIYNLKLKKWRKPCCVPKIPVLLVWNSDYSFGQNEVLQAELQLFYTECRVRWNISCFCNLVCISVFPF